jgi:hypothetical protein
VEEEKKTDESQAEKPTNNVEPDKAQQKSAIPTPGAAKKKFPSITPRRTALAHKPASSESAEPAPDMLKRIAELGIAKKPFNPALLPVLGLFLFLPAGIAASLNFERLRKAQLKIPLLIGTIVVAALLAYFTYTGLRTLFQAPATNFLGYLVPAIAVVIGAALGFGLAKLQKADFALHIERGGATASVIPFFVIGAIFIIAIGASPLISKRFELVSGAALGENAIASYRAGKFEEAVKAVRAIKARGTAEMTEDLQFILARSLYNLGRKEESLKEAKELYGRSPRYGGEFGDIETLLDSLGYFGKISDE